MQDAAETPLVAFAVSLSILYLRCSASALSLTNAASAAAAFNSLFEMLYTLNRLDRVQEIAFNSLFEMHLRADRYLAIHMDEFVFQFSV